MAVKDFVPFRVCSLLSKWHITSVRGSEYCKRQPVLDFVPCGAAETVLCGVGPQSDTSRETTMNKLMEGMEMPASAKVSPRKAADPSRGQIKPPELSEFVKFMHGSHPNFKRKLKE